MPMIKASKIWNKLSCSPSVFLVKRPVCLCLNSPSIRGIWGNMVHWGILSTLRKPVLVSVFF